jgi:hypothetical protein
VLMRRALWCLCLVLVGLFSTPGQSDDGYPDRGADEKAEQNASAYFLKPFALAMQPALTRLRRCGPVGPVAPAEPGYGLRGPRRSQLLRVGSSLGSFSPLSVFLTRG